MADARTVAELGTSGSRSKPTTSGRTRRSRSDRRDTVVINILRAAVAVGFLVAWELAARSGAIDPAMMGQPSRVWTELVSTYESGSLVTNTLSTLNAMLIALAISIPAGLLTGLGAVAFPVIDRVLGPFLIPLNSLPRIALAPLFIIWFGLTTEAKVALAASIVYFIIHFNTKAGAQSVEPDLLTVGKLLGLSRWRIFAKIVLPSSVPTIFAGIRLAVTYALLGVIASEMVAAREGLGLEIVRYSNMFQISAVLGILALLATIAMVFGVVLGWAERRLLRWQ